ncbi:MAG TPA: hypothetical protein VMS79_04500 [Methanomassiliicoccales archaeon]|jgi:archaellum component FlaF (FlaF/FlaG flagellin family)|nr:hypothetical protein [Methanomassiliicoccales archaeon]
MGLSVSGASAILFVAFVIVFAAVFGAADRYAQAVMTSQERLSERNQDTQSEKLSLVAIDRANGTIEISNAGSTNIEIGGIDILVNGSIANVTSRQVIGHPGSQQLYPMEDAVLEVAGGLADARIKVVSPMGVCLYSAEA